MDMPGCPPEVRFMETAFKIKGLLDAIDAKGLSVEEVIKWVEEYKAE
jgi:hypothetical protein